MQPTEEILNLDYHRRRMLIKAINKYNFEEAANKLGVSRRTVYRWMIAYKVSDHEVSNRLILTSK